MPGITHTYQKRNMAILAVIGFTNVLFLGKYLVRYTNYTIPAILVYLVALVALYRVWNKGTNTIPISAVFLSLALVCVGSVIGFSRFPVEKLNVDRWSVIYTFFDALKSGTYPYGVRSNMSNLPGPLPVYFVMAYPFYLLKEIGYMPLLALVLLTIYLFNKGKKENTDYTFALFILMFSPFMLWEIFARSTVFFVSVLWYIYADWLLTKGIDKPRNLIFAGLFGGLLLSTRFIYVLLLGLYGIYFIKQKIKLPRIILWGVVTIIALLITLLPLYILYPTDFIKSNPFQTESLSYIPFWLNFLFPILALGMGFLAKDNKQAIFFSGMVLLLVVALYFGFHIVKDGWTNTFYLSFADISYFIIPIPFLLGVMGKESIKN